MQNKTGKVKSLHLKNFQAHKSLKIEFGGCITSIIGPSDAGKSSIIRALRWILLNQPRGNEFVRHGEKRVYGRLEMSEGTVKRIREGNENQYIVNGNELTAFKYELPDEVKNLTRVGDINIQSQHDSPFWFSESAGEVSRRLNEIVDLEIIDKTLSNLAVQIRQLRAEEAVAENRTILAREERRALSYTPELVKAYESIVLAGKALEKSRSTIRTFNDLVQKGIGYRVQEKEANVLHGILKILYDLRKRAVESAAQKDRLEERIHRARRLEKKGSATLPDLTGLEKKNKTAKGCRDRVENLTRMIRKIRSKEEEVCQKKKEAKETEVEWKEATKGTCPLCGGKMS